jgi:hypothetical protein
MVLLTTSCADDPIARNSEQSDNVILFDSWVYSDNSKSRANNGCAYEEFKADKFDDRELYLVSGVKSGIDASKLAAADDADGNAEGADSPTSRATTIDANTLLNSYLNRTTGAKFYIDLYAYKYEAKTSYANVAVADAKYGDVVADGTNIEKFIDGGELHYESTADDGSLTMTCNTTYRWDGHDSNRMSFIGIFPAKKQHRISDSRYVMSYDNNTPKMYYEIDASTGQIDLMCAQYNCAGNGSTNNNTVKLAMKHILAGLQFSLGDGFTNCVITGVTLSNVYVAGTYNTATETWDLTSAGNAKTGNRSITIENDVATTATGANDNTLFLITPQTLPENAQMSITVYHKDTDTTETLTKTISGTWEMGKTITYQLSVNPDITEYFITTEYSTMKYGWGGKPAGDGTAYTETTTSNGVSTTKTLVTDVGNIRVKSYKSVTSNRGGTTTTNYYAVPWTAKGYDASGNELNSSTLTIQDPKTIDASSVDVTDYATYNSSDADYNFKLQNFNYTIKAYMNAQTRSEVASTEKQTIRANSGIVFGGDYATTKNWENRIDLSSYRQKYTQSGTKYVPVKWQSNGGGEARYTANCYMIQFPGYYTLPCCYGNSLYVNHDLVKSHVLGTSGNHAMNSLKAYNGNAINANWINASSLINGGANPTSAVLLWSDVKDLVTNVSLHTKSNGGEYYVDFDIPSTTIEPGNAVIAIKTGSTIMWSWHIWVTPWAGSDVFTADASKNASMGQQQYLKVPLGYVQNSTYVWAEREYTLKLTQSEGKNGRCKSTDVTLLQEEHRLPRVSCCYYQWGRKDPFPGATIDEPTTGDNAGYMSVDGSYATSLTPTQNTLYNVGEAMNMSVRNTTTVASGIQHPTWFYAAITQNGEYSNRFPSDNNYYDLWGCTEDYANGSKSYNSFPATQGSLAQKTVYDPSPIGFKVPPIHGFPAITWNGANYSNERTFWVDNPVGIYTTLTEYINTPYTSQTQFINNNGFEFYCAKMGALAGTKYDDMGTFTLNAFGMISNEGDYVSYGSSARYWSCSRWCNSDADQNRPTNSSTVTLGISYSNGSISANSIMGNTESYGCPVLPMWDTTPAY